MQFFSKPITQIISRRFSCRTYIEKPIDQEKKLRLLEFIASQKSGPLGAKMRFELVAATEQDRSALKGLGTYGFIRGAGGFILGAVLPAQRDLEDFGHLMEQIILLATDLGLGTCWLGGTFTRSSFAHKISLGGAEQIPAVVAIGHMPEKESIWSGLIRRQVAADQRRPWERLFFSEQYGVALARQEAGDYATALEMVRLAPSASNRQPWRVIKVGDHWHFYLRRSEGYRRSLFANLLNMADLQRIDMGIAMCHFELAAKELGLEGKWAIKPPAIIMPSDLIEYTISWIGNLSE